EHDARDDIGRAAGSKRDDRADRLAWPCLRERIATAEEQDEEAQEHRAPHTALPPRLVRGRSKKVRSRHSAATAAGRSAGSDTSRSCGSRRYLSMRSIRSR